MNLKSVSNKAIIGLLVIMMVSPLSSIKVEAASESKTVTFNPSTSRNQSQTIDLGSKFVKVNSVTVNTGNVNYSVNGSKVTINVSNGAYVSRDWDAKLNSKTVIDYTTSSVNSFASTKNYNSGGYSGTLSKNGNSYVSSGSYTPAHTINISLPLFKIARVDIHEAYRQSNGKLQWGIYETVPDPADETKTKSYNSGGYIGTYTRTPYRNLSHMPGYWRANTVETKRVPYPSNPYEGQRHEYMFYDAYYTWEGTATKPASDTRVYRQDYKGTVYQGGYKNYKYGYSVTINYTTDTTPPDGSFSPNSSNWRNSGLTVSFTPTDTGGSGVKEWRYRVSKDAGSSYNAWTTVQGDTTRNISLSEGKNKIQATVYDNAGNSRNITSGEYLIEFKKPKVTSSPAPTDDWGNTGVNITLDYSDTGGSGVKTKQYKWSTSPTLPSTWDNYSGSVNQNEDGIWYLHYKVQDNAGNEATGYFAPYKIDTLKPKTTINENDFSYNYSEDILTIDISNITDDTSKTLDVSGINKDNIYLMIKGKDKPTFKKIKLSPGLGTKYKIDIKNVLEHIPETIEFKVSAKDNAGNEGESALYEISTISLNPTVKRMIIDQFREDHIFKAGESGLLQTNVKGDFDRLEITYPNIAKDWENDESKIIILEGASDDWQKREFAVNLYNVEPGEYEIKVKMVKVDGNGIDKWSKEGKVSLEVLTDDEVEHIRSQSILDSLKTKLR